MITEEFLNTISPRLCRLLRQLLVVKDVPIDVRPAYPHYRALLNLLRMITTLKDPSDATDADTAGAEATQKKDTTSVGPSDMAAQDKAWTREPKYELTTTVALDSAAGSLRGDTSSTPQVVNALSPLPPVLTGRSRGAVQDIRPMIDGHENYSARGPSRSVVDLVKAYSSERSKFNGEDPEQSLQLIQRSFLSACKLMHVNPSEALED
jgi:hypothetical protein